MSLRWPHEVSCFLLSHTVPELVKCKQQPEDQDAGPSNALGRVQTSELDRLAQVGVITFDFHRLAPSFIALMKYIMGGH